LLQRFVVVDAAGGCICCHLRDINVALEVVVIRLNVSEVPTYSSGDGNLLCTSSYIRGDFRITNIRSHLEYNYIMRCVFSCSHTCTYCWW
jgi:hypothetical protein